MALSTGQAPDRQGVAGWIHPPLLTGWEVGRVKDQVVTVMEIICDSFAAILHYYIFGFTTPRHRMIIYFFK